MRRPFLIFALLSFSGWSQPAQQQAQPPIVVQVQMPPTNPWIHMLELIVPGIIGAGLALFGVWLTNKHNAATNAENRQHSFALEKMKAETAVKQQKYEHLIDSISQVTALLAGCIDTTMDITLKNDPEGVSRANRSKLAAFTDQKRPASITLAALYASPDVYKAVMVHAEVCYKCIWVLNQPYPFHQQIEKEIKQELNNLGLYKLRLIVSATDIIAAIRRDFGYDALPDDGLTQAAGRKDLWGTPDDWPNRKAES